KAREHPLFRVLHSRPNDWQTAFNFRQYTQRNALIHGNAYALIVRSMGRVIRLVPLHPSRVEVKQNSDFSVEYVYTTPNGVRKTYKPAEILHLYGDSENGFSGTSMVKAAGVAIDLAKELENAQRKFFKGGMLLGGMISLENKLSPEAY